MTCILALKYEGKVYMGGDSASMNGWDKNITAIQKVFHVGTFLIGFSGDTRMHNLLQWHVSIREPESDENDMHYVVTGLIATVRECLKENGFLIHDNNHENNGNSAFLVGYRGDVYWIGSNFDVSRFSDSITAVGTGADFALGALKAFMDNKTFKPKRDMLRALEISGNFCASVMPPYYVEVMPNV